MKTLRLPFILALFLIVIATAGCWIGDEALRVIARQPRILIPQIINVYPHDTSAFTQGLLWHDGALYESTGQYGESDVRRVDLETGEVLQITPLEAAYFAEGLALIPETDRLVQITWREGTAFVYDRSTFDLVNTFEYTGEGWGLCYDGEWLWMSDGSANLFQRDPQTFELISTLTVTLEGQPIDRINELECVGGSVYANIWYADAIVRISKATWQILDIIDARALLTPAQRAGLPNGAVLNGIAYVPERDTYLITGKLWEQIFEVVFVPVDRAEPSASG